MHGLSLIGMNYSVTQVSDSGEANLLKTIKTHFSNSEIVIFDVGANVGNYTNQILSVFGKKVTLFAFEPSKSTFSKLKGNVNQTGNIFLYNIGLGAVDETSILYSDGNNSEMASLYDRRLDFVDTRLTFKQEVEIQTLDSFCIKNKISHINLLKLDVEGNELNCLKGSKKMLEKDAIDFIQFEFGCNIDSKTYFQDFYYLLNDKYRIYRVLQNGLRLVKDYRPRWEIMLISNFLAVRKNKPEHR